MVGQAVKWLAAAIFFCCVGIAAAQEPPFTQHAPPLNPVTDNVQSAAAIVPSDTATIGPTKAIFNGNATACTIVMTLANDTASVTWQNVQPGSWMPVRAVRVFTTGTTCSGLVAAY